MAILFFYITLIASIVVAKQDISKVSTKADNPTSRNAHNKKFFEERNVSGIFKWTQEKDLKGIKFLKGRTLTIVTTHRPPFVYFPIKLTANLTSGITGYCIEMLDILASFFQFHYKIVLPYDGNWGKPMENGTWNGMVGMVYRKEVDLGLGPFSTTGIRDQVIDFTTEFYKDPLGLAIPIPKEKKDFFVFLTPFQWPNWLAILFSCIIVSTLMHVLSGLPNNSAYLYPFEKRIPTEREPLKKCFWSVASNLLGQDAKLKCSNSSRVVHGFWWCVCKILMVSYIGVIVAILTVPKYIRVANTFEELGNQNEALWTYLANSAHEGIFNKPSPPGSIVYNIGQLLREQPELKAKNDIEGFNMVINKGMVFIREHSRISTAIEQDLALTGKCNLAIAPGTYPNFGFGWIVEEDSDYLNLFNKMFQLFNEHGFMEYWKVKYFSRPNQCTSKSKSQVSKLKALTLDHLKGDFLILAIGLFIGFCVFLLEFQNKGYA